MAGSINKVILVGNIGQEPQVRTMNSGQKVVSFSLATSERWRDRNSGEQKEQTEWHRVVIFNPNLVEVADQNNFIYAACHFRFLFLFNYLSDLI